MKKKIFFYFYMPLSVFVMECAVRSITENVSFWGKGLWFAALFSVSFGALLAFPAALCRGRRASRILFTSALVLVTLYFSVQTVYYTIFRTFTTLSAAGGAGQAISSYWRETLAGIWAAKLPLLLIFAPLILWLVFGRHLVPERPRWAILLAAFLLFQFGGIEFILHSTAGVMSPSVIYRSTFVPNLSVSNFGVLTTLRLDIQRQLFPVAEPSSPEISQTPAPTASVTLAPSPSATPELEIDYGFNALDIDFDALIAEEPSSTVQNMHRYFASVEPTKKNAYTGLFEGKNLIWICAEGFSPWALEETHTPTLCRLASSGFVFTNYYNPLWAVSTSDGEYTTLTSLLPMDGTWTFANSYNRCMPFGFGTLFKDRGYNCFAFHDGTYDYYNRYESHKNLGYKFMALGDGLDLKQSWPESDVEMMEETVDFYLSDEKPFHVYYMTISGHLNYTFRGNDMARKHEADVQDLLDAGWSEQAAAYVACQMELDQALEVLMTRLDKAGRLDDTVIVLSNDHYPYGLSAETIEELNGGPLTGDFELYHSTLSIWTPELEENPIVVDKLCSALDIMPTLANLFALPYDSRLLMGRDILSDAEGLVIMSNRSWISEHGEYNSLNDSYTGNDPQAAISMVEHINKMFEMSAEIMNHNYYKRCGLGAAG